MDSHNPDKHGSYSAYFESWFPELKRGIEYGKKKICFKEIFFPALPGFVY
jgi:hypothetical protein